MLAIDRNHLPLLACVLLVVACPQSGAEDEATQDEATQSESDTQTESSDTQTESSDTQTESDTQPESETQTESSDTDVEEVCECIAVQGNDADLSEEPMLPTCATESCPIVEASTQTEWGTETGGDAETFMLDTPAALVCALEALRDRTPVLLQWDEDIDSGWASESGYVFIREDGLAVRRSRSWEDLGGEVSDAVLGELESPEHYQACLDDPDDQARFDCLRGMLATSMQICDEGWWISSI